MLTYFAGTPGIKIEWYYNPIFFGALTLPLLTAAILAIVIYYFVSNYLRSKTFTFNPKRLLKPVGVVVAFWVIFVLYLSFPNVFFDLVDLIQGSI